MLCTSVLKVRFNIRLCAAGQKRSKNHTFKGRETELFLRVPRMNIMCFTGYSLARNESSEFAFMHKKKDRRRDNNSGSNDDSRSGDDGHWSQSANKFCFIYTNKTWQKPQQGWIYLNFLFATLIALQLSEFSFIFCDISFWKRSFIANTEWIHAILCWLWIRVAPKFIVYHN